MKLFLQRTRLPPDTSYTKKRPIFDHRLCFSMWSRLKSCDPISLKPHAHQSHHCKVHVHGQTRTRNMASAPHPPPLLLNHTDVSLQRKRNHSTAATSATKNTIWRGSVLTGEELLPHSGELNHALSQEGGPTQSQLSRPMSSGHRSTDFGRNIHS